ncbi:MAG TPA: hypothetical protein VGQ58_07180 [Candidatus Limnocylindrales bacterium]|jgi:hypothetical protein|nr:hypothetical protein [Candidatus Limnocylindrales bacterium]
MTTPTVAWTEWIDRPEAGNHGEWTLACAHSSVTSEEVKQHFAPDVALGLFVALRESSMGLSADECVMVAVRLLLGQLLTERAGCSCAQRSFAVVHDEEQGYWIGDVPS